MNLSKSEILKAISGICPSLIGLDVDPTVDLVAARQVEEEALRNNGEWQAYVKALGLIFMRDMNAHGTWEIFCQKSEQGVCHGIIPFVRAAPIQRCEGVLRVRGLWPLEKYETPDLYIKPDVRPFEK